MDAYLKQENLTLLLCEQYQTRLDNQASNSAVLPIRWAKALLHGYDKTLNQHDQECVSMWLKNEANGSCMGISGNSFFSLEHDASLLVGACECARFVFA